MVAIAPKGVKKKVESKNEDNEGTTWYREPRSASETVEHALQMHQGRQNIALNEWFDKEKKKIPQHDEDLEEGTENDFLVEAPRVEDVLSFLDTHHIKNINNLVTAILDKEHPHSIYIREGIESFWNIIQD